MLGSLATGSSNNSNVLLGSLQNNVALSLGITPALLAAQTTGSAIGRMIAPAKIIVGCSTLHLKDHEGDALRITMPYCLLIGIVVGLIALVLAQIRRAMMSGSRPCQAAEQNFKKTSG